MEYLIRFRWALFLLLIFLSIGGLKYIKKALIPNNELSIWFVENDPTLKAYQDFSAQYGNDRLIMLLVHNSAGIFEQETIEQINKFTQQVVTVDGIKKTSSLTNSKDLFRIRINDTIRIKYVSPFSNVNLSDSKTLNSIRDQILSSSIFRGHLISEDGNSSIILIQLEAFEEIDAKRGIIIDEIESLARELFHSDEIYMGGLDVFTNELNKLSKHDFKLFMGITYLLISLLIFFSFNRWIYVLLSIGTMIISVMLTLSIYGIAGKQLNLFSLVIPSLIVILGLIHILHIINEFEFTRQKCKNPMSNKDVITQSLKKVFRPCLFTSLTTIIGFLSLLSSSTAVLKEFGLFAAVGILIVFICSFIFSAVILPYASISNSHSKIGLKISNLLVRISVDIQQSANKYWAAIVILCAISVFGISRIKADMFVMEYFPKSNKVIRDHHYITKHWGNYIPIDYLIKTNDGYSFKNSPMLKILNEFQKEVSAIPEINSAMSIINLIDKASTVILKKEIENLLTSPSQTHRFLNNLQHRSEIDISNFISDDYHTARITFTGPLLSVSDLEEKITQIKKIGEKHFGDKAKLSETSYPALYLKIMNYAVDSMLRSFGLAVILILITLIILLRNIQLALIAMIPNLFPIFLMLAFMGLAGINLDLTTATVASIALGIAVDDTIHILSHYQLEIKSGKYSASQAIANTHFHIGKIIVISSIVLFAGYIILLFASIKTVVYFGILTLVAISAALIGDIILLPLLLKLFKIKA